MTKTKLYQETVEFYQQDEYKEHQEYMAELEARGRRLSILLALLATLLVIVANMAELPWAH